VGTLYNFFESKEGLYARVVEHIAHDFMRLLEERVLGQPDTEAAIASLIELRLTYFDEHRGFFRVFLETSPSVRFDPARAMPENCADVYDKYIDAVRAVFAKGVRNGQFDDVDPLYQAFCLEGVINAFVVYRSRRAPEEPLETCIAKMQDAFLGRIRRRAAAKETKGPRSRN